MRKEIYFVGALACVFCLEGCTSANCREYPQDCAISVELQQGSEALYKPMGGKISVRIGRRTNMGPLTARLIQTSPDYSESTVKTLTDPLKDDIYSIEFTMEDIKKFAPEQIATLNVQESEARGSAEVNIKLKNAQLTYTLNSSVSIATQPDKLVEVGLYKDGIIPVYQEYNSGGIKRKVLHYQFVNNKLSMNTSGASDPYWRDHDFPTSLIAFTPTKALISRTTNMMSIELSSCVIAQDQICTRIGSIQNPPNLSAIAISEKDNFYAAAYLSDSTKADALPTGSLAPAKIWPLLPAPGIKFLKLIDLNGDGKEDVLAVKPDGLDILALIQGDSRSFAVANPAIITAIMEASGGKNIGQPVTPITGMGVGDLNGDGEFDILVARNQTVYPVFVSGRYFVPGTPISAKAPVVGLAAGRIEPLEVPVLVAIDTANLSLYLAQPAP